MAAYIVTYKNLLSFAIMYQTFEITAPMGPRIAEDTAGLKCCE